MSASCTSWPKGCLLRISNVKLTSKKVALQVGRRLTKHACELKSGYWTDMTRLGEPGSTDG